MTGAGPQHVRLTDVAPRDGLQAEPMIVPTADKARLVRACASTGVREVEVSSFVSPKWVPQLGDASELFALVAPDKPDGVIFSALVPNERGLETLLEVNRLSRESVGTERLIDKVAVFTAASEGFAQKNTNASIEETLIRFEPVIERAKAQGLLVRGYVSCVVACPYDGPVSPAMVADVCAHLAEMGVDELDLGDTIGAATPADIDALLPEVIGRVGGFLMPEDEGGANDEPRLTLHLHDTRGMAGACVRAALELGVRSFDASSGGLGGCPFASTPGRRAPGNVSLRTVARVVHDAGFSTGLDDARLAEAERVAEEVAPRGAAR